MIHNEKVFEITVNKDNHMLLPSKNVSLLFENKLDEEDEEK